ncbi:hypothetical protein ABZ990_14705 [Streptomyces sp. NPDC046203]
MSGEERRTAYPPDPVRETAKAGQRRHVVAYLVVLVGLVCLLT